MWICPKCKEEITRLNYRCSTQGYESGSADLSDSNEEDEGDIITDHDCDDSGTNESDNYEYDCPKCSAYINADELIWKENNDDDEEEEKIAEPEETLHNIIKPKNNIISERQQIKTNNNGIICTNKKCKYVFVYESNTFTGKDEFCDCPKCGTTMSINQFLIKLNKI